MPTFFLLSLRKRTSRNFAVYKFNDPISVVVRNSILIRGNQHTFFVDNIENLTATGCFYFIFLRVVCAGRCIYGHTEWRIIFMNHLFCSTLSLQVMCESRQELGSLTSICCFPFTPICVPLNNVFVAQSKTGCVVDTNPLHATIN
jgi:Ni,Fe-hydrogenase I cytochrome b subunit